MRVRNSLVRRRRAVSAVIAIGGVLLVVAGIWLGEGNRPGRGIDWLFYHGGLSGLLSAAAIFVLSTAISVHVLLRLSSWRRPWMLTAVISCALVALSTIGFVLGDRSKSRAIHSCFDHQEDVRKALRTYHSVHGSYPASLDSLTGVQIPGDRILRGSVLNYRSTDDGYVLSVADPLMISEATETHGFISSK